MEDAANGNVVTFEGVVYGEREPPHERSPQPTMHDPTGGRHGRDEPKGAIELLLEFLPETRATGLVPRKSLRDVGGGFGPKL